MFNNFYFYAAAFLYAVASRKIDIFNRHHAGSLNSLPATPQLAFCFGSFDENALKANYTFQSEKKHRLSVPGTISIV